jgi:DNA gyrase inhibitor GyrI
MSDMSVRIVELEPMQVASVHAFGPSPEGDAWAKLAAWAEPRGLFGALDQHRIFGFNNPSPAPGSPNYGYEFWIEVAADMPAEGEVTFKAFDGGRYAVTRCKGVENIAPTWRRFMGWLETSPYRLGKHQWLEQHLGAADTALDELEMDLYMPIAG